MTLGTWNIWSGHTVWNRAEKQWNKAWQQDWDAATWRNFLGLIPFGSEYDDPCEPSMSDVLKRKANQALKKPGELIREIGGFGF